MIYFCFYILHIFLFYNDSKINKNLYNVYPIYDWKTQDIWVYLGKNPNLPSNLIYSKMSMAGVPISEQRLCQPYGDDQKKGLWLYHILEPETWFKLINRVSGVNSGALYIQESGNINGYRFIEKPENINWKEYTNLLLSTLPKNHDKFVLEISEVVNILVATPFK
jgi:predicted phosphoadenosine phosphosulfate sulfurtransferase